MQGICRVYAGFPHGLTFLMKIGVFSKRSMTKRVLSPGTCKISRERLSSIKKREIDGTNKCYR
jgi:hypothetical protein